jgi:signal peptidase II
VGKRWIFLPIAVLIVVFDQLTKSWIRTNLLPGESLPEIGPLVIIHIGNTGAAFGFFTDQAFLLTLIAIAGLVVILLFFRYLPKTTILSSVALGLVFGGALGNLTDRLLIGHVTDFIYVRLWGEVFWPAFNIADASISVGVIALAIYLITGLKDGEGHNSSTVN